jgi:hypothetical protein
MDPNLGLLGRVLILSGTVIAEQIEFRSVSLGGITIESEDAVVDVDCSEFITRHSGESPFLTGSWATMPCIGTMFRCINRGSKNTIGLRLWGGSSARHIHVNQFSNLAQLPDGAPEQRLMGWDSWSIGILVGGGSLAEISFIDILNSVQYGVSLNTRGSVISSGTRIVGSGTNSVRVTGGSTLNISTSSTTLNGFSTLRADFRKGEEASDTDIFLATHSSVVITGTAYLAGFNIPINTWRKAGIVSVQSASGPLAFDGIPLATGYTTGTLPSASDYERGMIYVSDGINDEPAIAYSDGSTWKYQPNVAQVEEIA